MLRPSLDRGAVLVEFAAVALLLFSLLFGIIEFGVNFNDYQSLRQSARDGARQAVVDSTSGTTTCATSAVGTAPGGNTVTAQARRIICATQDGDNAVAVRIRYIDGDPGFNNDSVEVCATRLARTFTGFFPFLQNRPLRTSVTMRAEKDDLSVAWATTNGTYIVGEADPSGDNWSWC